MVKRRWVIGDGDYVLQEHLSTELKITPLVSRILINRGIRDLTSARDFLHISEANLHDPFLMNDMEKAVSRIIQAIHNRKRILIYGDYDVDGVTASTLYLEFLSGYGADVDLHIPDRMHEGYGLNETAVLMARSHCIDVIVTADCGTTSIGPIKLAQTFGIDVIVTDHHETPVVLPDAFALLNPNRHDSTYPFKGLTGVGVAFKLVQALSMTLGNTGATPTLSLPLQGGGKKGGGQVFDNLSSYLDLVALGTIADIAPLTGENRFFVKNGLKLLTEEKRSGIAALKEVAGIGRRDVNTGAVSFLLAPRINASGRIYKADLAVKLLTTRDREEARSIAIYLDNLNQQRQRIETRIRDEIREEISTKIDFKSEKVIIMASQEWHQGVIGIVASKIVDEFYRPCILISIQEDGSGKGSARSIPGFNMYEGLAACGDLLERFGGHRYAAGLTINGTNIPLLHKKLSTVIAEKLKEEDFIPKLILDAEIELEELNFPLLKEMTLLPPYGVSNPEPVIVSRRLQVIEPKLVGKDHLKIKLRKGKAYFGGIGFSMASAYNNIIKVGREVDVVYTPELNFWNGTYGIQLKLKDMRISEECQTPKS